MTPTYALTLEQSYAIMLTLGVASVGIAITLIAMRIHNARRNDR